MVTHHIRILQDKVDYDLHSKGWQLAGLSLWTHPIKPNQFFTKEEAVKTDIGDYRSLEYEHAEMLECLLYIASGDGPHVYVAKELLDRLKY